MKHIVRSFIALLAALVTVHAQSSDLAIAFNYPTNGAAFQSPANLGVTATESSNTIVSAEFFANGQSIGVVGNNGTAINLPILPGSIGITLTETIIFAHPDSYPDTRSYSLLWSPEPGDYTLTAKATDDQGNTAVSDPVNVTVIPTPTVSVEASVSIASTNGPGIFTITRTGNTNSDLKVNYFLLGTARNGIDYSEVSTYTVTIPAGQFSTDIDIEPLVYKRGNSKTVDLKLFDYLVPGGGGPGPVPQIVIENPPFLLGSPNEATIYIKANDIDRHKPRVKITQPRRRQSYLEGADITITAHAVDRDTGVSWVEFFDGATKLGQTPLTTTTQGELAPFSFTWTNPPVGPHALHARATDSQGAQQVSPPVQINVLPAQ
jgi:hypothetical protein